VGKAPTTVTARLRKLSTNDEQSKAQQETKPGNYQDSLHQNSAKVASNSEMKYNQNHYNTKSNLPFNSKPE